MDERKLRGLIRVILEHAGASPYFLKQVLQKVDDGPYHMLPADELEDDELSAAEALVMRGRLKRLPATERFPERFVLSSAGSHETGTFDMDTWSEERPRRRRPMPEPRVQKPSFGGVKL